MPSRKMPVLKTLFRTNTTYVFKRVLWQNVITWATKTGINWSPLGCVNYTCQAYCSKRFPYQLQQNDVRDVHRILHVHKLNICDRNKSYPLKKIVNPIFYRPYSTRTQDFNLQNSRLRSFIRHLVEKYDTGLDQVPDKQNNHESHSYMYKLTPVVTRCKDYFNKESEMEELQCIITENTDADMAEMAKSDIQVLQQQLDDLEEEIMQLIVPVEGADHSDSVILELSAGVGGQEAMLFTSDILDMYTNYATYRGWTFIIINVDYAEQGGVRKASAVLEGLEVYKYMKYEGGVHRVQRVPKTERQGRIHTSTMAVAIMPKPNEIEVEINPKDLKVSTFRASGPGGQHVNKTESAVRVVHVPTGTTAECQIYKTQYRNKEVAIDVIRSRLYQQELEKRRSKEFTLRKLQVGHSGRSEKIRTYNFQQHRVTDHRIGRSIQNLEEFMKGGDELHSMMDAIQEESTKESLLELITQFEMSQKEKL